MPLYEYRCTQCGNRYEKIQTFSAEPDRVCPKCGGKVERPLTAPALQFKGAGWYINDYAPKAASGSSSGEKPAGASEAKTSEAKPAAAESKPASTESAAPKSTPSSSSGSTG
ncbi:zinc ribbon domain-containing protein [Acidobacteria bacterium AB60]|nr:zinc ribbon domain-containing protein [Acidobacteria bacterium AB60]